MHEHQGAGSCLLWFTGCLINIYSHRLGVVQLNEYNYNMKVCGKPCEFDWYSMVSCSAAFNLIKSESPTDTDYELRSQ